MRRRHGIPDDDHRPFNVAYAAVVRTRKDREAQDRTKAKQQNAAPPRDQRNALAEAQIIRQRFADAGMHTDHFISSYQILIFLFHVGGQRNVASPWSSSGTGHSAASRYHPSAADNVAGSSSARPNGQPMYV